MRSGNSQNGNNNAYCQDNRIGWVNWKNEGRYEEYTEFVRELLQFRKEHPILFSEKPFQMSDYKRTGYPDLILSQFRSMDQRCERECKGCGRDVQ